MKNYIKDERLKQQLTQAALAEKVNVSRQTIISIESNRYIPSSILAIKIAKALGRRVEDIFILEKGD